MKNVKITERDAILQAIESITSKHVIYYHVEANRYTFKFFTPLFGRYWHTLDVSFVDEIAKSFKHIK